MNLPSSLRALRYYNFRLYFVGQAVSLIGTWMQRIAVNWLVYDVTHSAFYLGLVAFAGQLPMLLLSPYAGAYVDRHSRYRTLMATQVASMIQAGLLALVVFLGYYHMPTIIILSLVLGVINAFDTPARQSLMIVLVQHKTDLPNAIALNSSMVTMARLAGPAVAGILLSSFGEDICFGINFISFVAVIVSLLLMKLKIPERKKHIDPIWKGLQEGFVYLRHHRGLLAAIALMAFTSFLAMPYTNMFPIYAQTVYKGNVTTFSWMNSIGGLGALFGAIYMANRKPNTNFLRLIVLSSMLFCLSIMLFSYTTHVFLGMCLIMIGEAGMLSQIAATNTYVQTRVEESMRGRVLSYYVMAFQGMQPLGSLLVGGIAHRTSAPLTLFFEGLFGLLAAIAFIPALRRVRKREDRQRALGLVD
ncbi:MAG TPA: MFS transporter [Flavisolibacter sp.]